MQENRLHSMRVRTGKSTCSRAIHAHGNRRATAAGQASSGPDRGAGGGRRGRAGPNWIRGTRGVNQVRFCRLCRAVRRRCRWPACLLRARLPWARTRLVQRGVLADARPTGGVSISGETALPCGTRRTATQLAHGAACGAMRLSMARRFKTLVIY